MAFKNYLFLGVVSAIVTILAALVYTMGYYSIIVDFSEGMSMLKIVAYAFLFGVSFAFIHALLRKIIVNGNVADFILGTLVTILSMGLVFMVLDMEDPQFENEDAQLFIMYYKGFVMPLLFLPGLIYLSLKSLFIKG